MSVPALCTVSLALMLGTAALPAMHASAAEGAGRAEQLKAAYLLNFAKFVEWPNTKPDDALTVCFMGSNAVRDAFAESAAGRKIGGHVVIIRLLERAQPGDACDMLFIDAATNTAAAAAVATSERTATLTISDVSGFVHAGGMIELFADHNRLRFHINLANANRAGMRIRSDLLQLAASVAETASP